MEAKELEVLVEKLSVRVTDLESQLNDLQNTALQNSKAPQDIFGRVLRLEDNEHKVALELAGLWYMAENTKEAFTNEEIDALMKQVKWTSKEAKEFMGTDKLESDLGKHLRLMIARNIR